MALSPTVMYRGQPNTSSTTLYSVANTAGKYAIVKQVVVCNVTGNAATISMATVPSGGSELDNNRFLKDAVVLPNTTVVFDFSLVLGRNESVRASASAANTLTVTISGVAN